MSRSRHRAHKGYHFADHGQFFTIRPAPRGNGVYLEKDAAYSSGEPPEIWLSVRECRRVRAYLNEVDPE